MRKCVEIERNGIREGHSQILLKFTKIPNELLNISSSAVICTLKLFLIYHIESIVFFYYYQYMSKRVIKDCSRRKKIASNKRVSMYNAYTQL